jgi:4-oxalocrotonate tautomerase family enzyme
MPIVTIDLYAGRTAEMKHDLVVRVTDAVITALGVPADQVVIELIETPDPRIAATADTPTADEQ